MEQKINEVKLIREQVADLERRVKETLNQGEFALFPSLAVEYGLLVHRASMVAYTQPESVVYNDLVRLSTETKIVPQRSKESPYVQLRWLDNSISKLTILVGKLQPESGIDIELHTKVIDASSKLFIDGHYSEAIFAAFRSLEEYIKEKSKVKKIGKDLMANVFNENNPTLKIKCSHPDTADEEQEGFKFLFMGAMLGIRDPKAHYKINQGDKIRTLQYLALASLLFKTVDDSSLTT